MAEPDFDPDAAVPNDENMDFDDEAVDEDMPVAEASASFRGDPSGTKIDYSSTPPVPF